MADVDSKEAIRTGTAVAVLVNLGSCRSLEREDFPSPVPRADQRHRIQPAGFMKHHPRRRVRGVGGSHTPSMMPQ